MSLLTVLDFFPPFQALVTFHDVSACFSVEEWGALEDWQKELYKNVMREIHAALLSMGESTSIAGAGV